MEKIMHNQLAVSNEKLQPKTSSLDFSSYTLNQ